MVWERESNFSLPIYTGFKYYNIEKGGKRNG